MPGANGRTYFHCHPATSDPGELLDPEHQVSEPWGEPNLGSCDKCEGGGAVFHRCFSCMEAGADPGCPACQGRVGFEQTCPACGGSGEIHRTRRRGVAVFPRREGLYRYLAWKGDAEVEDRLVVELAGALSDDRDLDADHGALLVFPDRIVSVEPLDPGLVGSIRARTGEEAQAGQER